MLCSSMHIKYFFLAFILGSKAKKTHTWRRGYPLKASLEQQLVTSQGRRKPNRNADGFLTDT